MSDLPLVAPWTIATSTATPEQQQAARNFAMTQPDGELMVEMLGGMTTELTISIPRALWLTSNRQIGNRGYRARLVSDLQGLAILAARGHDPIEGAVAALWTVRYPRGVRTDKGEASNAQPTTKALLDGIVRAGLIEDDGPAWVASETFQRGPNLERPGDHEITLRLYPPF